VAITSRIASTDEGYEAGDLSVYPQALDDKEQLYDARNNAETHLKHSLTYNGRHIVAEDASAFPANGLLRVGQKGNFASSPELIYYGKRTNTVFSDLIRGFAGSRQNAWAGGPATFVSGAVMAEHHNSVKDAIINIQHHLGLRDFPAEDSLNGVLQSLESRYLAPKPFFRAYPLKGPSGTTVRFQNFSEGDSIRFLWDFGDGTTSIQRHPFHQYQQEGVYTVKLNIITVTGAQGVAVKKNYVTINNRESRPFLYYQTLYPGPNYSVETAEAANDPAIKAQQFTLVDQTDADVKQRSWIFDDGTNFVQTDPDRHSISHTYKSPGEYEPSLFIIFGNEQLKRVFLTNKITVI
jgi:PKD repeat protein